MPLVANILVQVGQRGGAGCYAKRIQFIAPQCVVKQFHIEEQKKGKRYRQISVKYARRLSCLLLRQRVGLLHG